MKKLSSLLALSLVFCLLLSACGQNTDTMEKANELFEAEDYPAAMEIYKAFAEKGNSEAMRQIGLMYLDGLGVDMDYDKAWEYCEKAVSKGYPIAANTLGFMCQMGYGREQDIQAAVKYYEQAAEAGSARAYMNLGGTYMRGLLGEPDYEKTICIIGSVTCILPSSIGMRTEYRYNGKSK